MKTVYKYSFHDNYAWTQQMFDESKILHVGLDPQGFPCFWAEVHTMNGKHYEKFHCVYTGSPLPLGGEYLGTVVHGLLVKHLYRSNP